MHRLNAREWNEKGKSDDQFFSDFLFPYSSISNISVILFGVR